LSADAAYAINFPSFIFFSKTENDEKIATNKNINTKDETNSDELPSIFISPRGYPPF